MAPLRGVLIAAVLVVTGCGPVPEPDARETLEPRPSTPTTVPTQAPTDPPATPPSGDAAAFAVRACADARYPECRDDALFVIWAGWSGYLAGVCDFADGTGEIVLVSYETGNGVAGETPGAEEQCRHVGEYRGTTGELVGVSEVP